MDIGKVLEGFLKPLGWFLTLGKQDTKHIRDELEDLLVHTSTSLKTFIELREAMVEIPEAAFDQAAFEKVYYYCRKTFTSSDAAGKARTHCTDIIRDIDRIEFKVSKYLRAENMDWKGLNQAFSDLKGADVTFLHHFETLVDKVDQDLLEIAKLLESKLDTNKRKDAWKRYESLRRHLAEQDQGLVDTLKALRDAQVHVRRLLT